MATRVDAIEWLQDALNALGGKGTIASICKWVWENHEKDLLEIPAIYSIGGSTTFAGEPPYFVNARL